MSRAALTALGRTAWRRVAAEAFFRTAGYGSETVPYGRECITYGWPGNA